MKQNSKFRKFSKTRELKTFSLVSSSRGVGIIGKGG